MVANDHIEDLDKALLEKEGENNALLVTIEEKDSIINELTDRNAELNKDIEEVNSNVSELEKEMEALREEIKSLQDKNKLLSTASSSQSKNETKQAQTPKQSSVSNQSDDGWKSMTVNASAYTLVENGDKLGGSGLTSIGAVPTANRTIAVDPNVIPYGSKIKYNGVVYTAEDTGGMINGNMVDIFVNTLDEALTFGRKDINILVKTP